MTNPYYENGGQPADATKAVAKRVRNELINVEAGFTNFPVLADMLVGFTYTATTTGTANTYVAAVSAKVVSYLDHLRLSLRINVGNTGASTVDVNSLGAKAIKAPDGSDLSTGDILSGKDILIEYNSSLGYFIYNGPLFTTASAAAIAAAIAAAPTNIVNDATPQLGGTLDTNSHQVRWSKGADVASATALTLGTDGNYFDITGTTQVTSIGALAVGTVVKVHFDGALILTHSATDLVLPSGANITTAAGDEAEFVEYAAGDWRCTSYVKADGTALVASGQRVGDYRSSFLSTADTGYLPADGSVYLQSAYPDLFTAIGQLSSAPNIKLPNPSILPASEGRDVAFSPNGVHMAVVVPGSPYITIYKINGNVFNALDTPLALPAAGAFGVEFSPDGASLVVGHGTSPYITIYDIAGDDFTKIANPASLPSNRVDSISFTTDTAYMAVADLSSPFVGIYTVADGVFTKLSNPATLPAGNGTGVSFGADNTYLAVSHAVSPYITIYKRSGSTFTKLANPATLPAAQAQDCAFSEDGVYLAVAVTASPYVIVYKRSGDVFTKLADPATLPPASAQCVNFSMDGLHLGVAHANSPYITIYSRSGDVFTKIADPATLPTNNAAAIRFSPNPSDKFMAVGHAVSPNVTIYEVGLDTGTEFSTPNKLPNNLNTFEYIKATA